MPYSITSSDDYQQLFRRYLDPDRPDDLSTRAKMEQSWKINFPTVNPVSIPVNCEDFPPKLKWATDAFGDKVLESKYIFENNK